MERKLCAACGQPSLKTEPHCWACGGAWFGEPEAGIAGDRTICLGDGADRTISLDEALNRTICVDDYVEPTVAWQNRAVSGVQPALWRRPGVIGGAAAFTLLVSLFGFWVGRATSPAQAGNRETRPEPTLAPAALPAPPTTLPPPQVVYTPAAPSVNTPDVSIRPVAPASPSTPLFAPRAPAAVAQATAAAPYRPISPPMPISQPSRVVVRAPVLAAAPSLPAAQPALPRPSGTQAVVSLRNNSTSAVEITLEGHGARTAIIAPGSSMPLQLSPGTYQLRASSRDASGASSTLSLVGNRTYALTVERRAEAGRGSLVFIEPAIDGEPA